VADVCLSRGIAPGRVRPGQVFLLPRSFAHRCGERWEGRCGALIRSGLDGKALIGAPFRPRPVVDGRLAMPGLGKGERESGRGDAGTPTLQRRLAEVDIGLLEQPLDLARRFERAVLVEKLAVGEIARAGDMAGAKPWPRLRGRHRHRVRTG